jgi:hypothetical protein
MSYSAPNKKGSRIRKKTTSIMNRKMFSKFLKMHPEYKGMTILQFNNIIKGFNNDIIESVIGNRDGVALPERLGEIAIITFPRPKRKIIDFGRSNEEGELRYHANWETDNKIGKIVYHKACKSIKNGRFLGLIPSRNFKQKMSTAFKKFWQRYIYIDNKRPKN